MDRDEFAKLLMAEDRKKWQNPEEILEQIAPLEGLTIVDVGCGPGFFTIPFATKIEKNGTVIAIDNDPVMLEHLGANIRKISDKSKFGVIKVIKADASKTKLPTSSADLVFFANLLHDLDSSVDFLNEMKRILKIGGAIVDLDWQKLETNEMGPPAEIRLSENNSRKIIRQNGFRIVCALNAGPYHYGFVCKRESEI